MSLKNLSHWLPICSLVTLSVSTHKVDAAMCNSNGTGTWNTSGIWTCGTVPASGDVIEIGANTTVTVNSNMTYSGSPMHVKVYGVWSFNGGGAKITLPCNSTVLIGFGGQVIGNGSGSSQTIKICSTTYWSASEGDVPGPAAFPTFVLPVEMISFNAKAKDDDVDLRWITASEQGSERFELYRSRNGDQWDRIGSVSAAGNSTTAIEYSFTDRVPAAGLWYFKLMQLDLDGSVHEKGILSVQVDEEKGSPVCELRPEGYSIGAHWPGHEVLSAEVIDLRGIRQRSRISSIEDDRAQLDISTLPPNAYVLMLIDPKGDREGCKFLLN